MSNAQAGGPWLDAEQLARYINAKSPAAARMWARRRGIEPGQGGRVHVRNVDRVIAGREPLPNTAFVR